MTTLFGSILRTHAHTLVTSVTVLPSISARTAQKTQFLIVFASCHRNVLLCLSVNKKRTQSTSELYRQSNLRLSAKLVPTFTYSGCHVVNMTDPYGRNLGFLDRTRFFQVAPHLYSRGWVDPIPNSLLLRKSGSSGNRTRTSWSVARNSDH
jgi:hypothetical protein